MREYLAKRSDALSAVTVGVHLLIVLGPVYISAVIGPGILMVLIWVYLGFSMNGILNLLHECAHWHVFIKKERSDLFGKYILAPMVFADFEGYRKRHWDHHRYLGVEGETKDAYEVDIKGRNLFTFFLSCLILKGAFKRFFKQIDKKPEETAAATPNPWFRNVIIFQGIFAASLFVVSLLFNDFWTALLYSVITYGFVYLYGLMSLTVFAATLRAVAEHQVHGEWQADTKGRAALRNFHCSFFGRFLMGAYGFAEHYTHHKFPAIPYYHLQAASAEFTRKDASYRPIGTYWSVIRTIFNSRKRQPHDPDPV
nr:fatty acid desaturase [Bacteroidota bacterium]